MCASSTNVVTMPSTPTGRPKRPKKVPQVPVADVTVDLSVLQRDWKVARRCFLKHVVKQQQHKERKLDIVQSLRPFRHAQSPPQVVELHHRLMTNDVDAQWLREAFPSSVSLIKALASIFHNDG